MENGLRCSIPVGQRAEADILLAAAMHEQLTECYVVESDYITVVYPDIPGILAYLNIRLVAVCDAFACLAPFVLWQFLFLF